MKNYYNLSEVNKIFLKKTITDLKKISKSGFYISASYVKKFEDNFAKYNGSKYSIAVANGFDALKLSLEAFKILKYCKAGDEVIVPANTYIATILAVSHSNLNPIFAEPEKKFFTLDPFEIEKRITKKTKVLIVTHLYGHLAQMDKIMSVAKKYNLRIIEDCSQAHGASFDNQKSGNFGDAGCFSLFPAKNLGALSDAGIITTNNKKVFKVLSSIRNYGEEIIKNGQEIIKNYGERKYKNIYKGFNSRMSEINASILNEKLKKLDHHNSLRVKKAQIYLKTIRNKLIILPNIKKNSLPVWHQFIILCKKRNLLKKILEKNGYPTRIIYPIPPHKQDAYKECSKLKLPITETIHRENLALPIERHHKIKDLKKIVILLNKFDGK